jgi:hypothetical protein
MISVGTVLVLLVHLATVASQRGRLREQEQGLLDVRWRSYTYCIYSLPFTLLLWARIGVLNL